jgi:hypothetical protein
MKFSYSILYILLNLLLTNVFASSYPISLSSQLKNSSAVVEASFVKSSVTKHDSHNYLIEYYFNLHSSMGLDISEVSKNHLFKVSHLSTFDPEQDLQNHFGEYLTFKKAEKVVLLLKYKDGNYWFTHGIQSRFNLFSHFNEKILVSHSFPMHPQLGSFDYYDFMNTAAMNFSHEESQLALDAVDENFEDEEKSLETKTYERTTKGRSIASQATVETQDNNEWGLTTTGLVLLLMLMCVIFKVLRINID